MRKLVLFLAVLFASAWTYLNFDAIKVSLQPIATAIFNASPPRFQRLVFSTDLPHDYRGVYMADRVANVAWARQRYASQPQSTGRRQVELNSDHILSIAHAQTIIDPVAVLHKGEDFVVVEYLTKGGTTRIDRDPKGIWIAFEDRAPGYKERFRRIR